MAGVEAPNQRSDLAVNGCQSQRGRTSADECELVWISVDTPQTVLKTAGVASAAVHQRSPTLYGLRRESMIVRRRPQSSAGLAVFLAVTEPN
jgi:hypothetical protein